MYTNREQMEVRVHKLETEVAVIRSNYATKEDIARLELKLAGTDAKVVGIEIKLAQLETKMVKWFITTSVAMSGLMITTAGLAFTAGAISISA
ncbi:MAG: hypothetical protein V4463_23225 [Pseudomonadota bacterium]